MVIKNKTSYEGYKKTKLGWIPEDWEVKQLKNLLKKIVGGGTPSKSQPTYWNGDIPWATVKDFTNFNSKETRDKITNIGLENSSSKLIEAGTVIIPTRMALGKAVCFEIDVAINQDLKALYTKPNFNSNFLLHWFYFKSEFIESLGNGSTVKGISLTDLGLIKIKLPPLQEQKAIASCLSTWDDALVKLDQLITAKQQLKKALMQQLLSGKKRLPGFTGEWTIWTYRELFKKVSRPVDWDDDDTYDLISVRRRSGGLFHRDSLKGVEILTKKLYTAREGDFLMSKMQILHGASGLVTREFDAMKISGSYIAVIPRNESILSMNYMSWYSQTPKFYHQTYRSSYGVHIEKMTFNYKLFEKEEVSIPSIEEQTAIAQVLKDADKEIELLKTQREQLQAQKKGLMQQLLTGKKRLRIDG